MNSFFGKIFEHVEVKRGASHLLVGLVIGAVSALIDGARGAKADDEA